MFLASGELRGSNQCSLELAAPQLLVEGPVAGQFSARGVFVTLLSEARNFFSKGNQDRVEMVNPCGAFTRGLALC